MVGWGCLSCDSIPGDFSLKWLVLLRRLSQQRTCLISLVPKSVSCQAVWGGGCTLQGHSRNVTWGVKERPAGGGGPRRAEHFCAFCWPLFCFTRWHLAPNESDSPCTKYICQLCVPRRRRWLQCKLLSYLACWFDCSRSSQELRAQNTVGRDSRAPPLRPQSFIPWSH